MTRKTLTWNGPAVTAKLKAKRADRNDADFLQGGDDA